MAAFVSTFLIYENCLGKTQGFLAEFSLKNNKSVYYIYYSRRGHEKHLSIERPKNQGEETVLRLEPLLT